MITPTLRIGLALFATALLAPSMLAAAPTPSSAPPPQSVPSAAPIATPLATPTAVPLELHGRLLDLRGGFVFFSSGDAYRLASDADLEDDDTHAKLAGDDVTARYATATFSADGVVRRLAVTNRTLADDTQSSDVKRFAVTLSTPKANPDLQGGEGMTGEPVIVTFTVEVPPATPLTENIYMATESSGWNAMAIHLDRVDALHYRITRKLPSGTHFVYRYTRGSWRTAERDRNGLEGPPRTYVVRNLDIARRKDTVYHWNDENAGGATLPGPDAVPTPVSGRPFTFSQ